MDPSGEFSIIEKYFTHDVFGAWKANGVGDDCAIIDTGVGRLAVTVDTLSMGTHFLPSTSAKDIGYKALAVNLSDLAAAGATPRAFFLSLVLPEKNDSWLGEFSEGLMALARQSGCALLGGDTIRSAQIGNTRSSLVISITALGELPQGQGLTRSGAKVGDDIWVSGTLGGAYAALQHRLGAWSLQREKYAQASRRLDRPEARNALGEELLSIASAAADVSDGFAQDLTHILDRSGVAATIQCANLPLDASLAELSYENQMKAVLQGGDDYELIFTAKKENRLVVENASKVSATPIHRVGIVRQKETMSDTVRWLDSENNVISLPTTGFNHF